MLAAIAICDDAAFGAVRSCCRRFGAAPRGEDPRQPGVTSAVDRHNPEMARLAMDAIPVIKARLAELEERGRREPLTMGRLAALWRAEARAAKLGLTIEDLRSYCLEMLRSRRALDDDTPDYLRGYREGFQVVLRDLRELE
jgi:hypothetical protein